MRRAEHHQQIDVGVEAEGAAAIPAKRGDGDREGRGGLGAGVRAPLSAAATT